MEPDSNKKRNPLQSLGFALSAIAIASVIAATAYAYKAHKEAQSEILILQTRNDALELQLNELGKNFTKFNEEMQEIRLDFLMKRLSGIVDFSTPNVQDIGNGFFLVKSEQEEHLTGIKIKGRIINAQSVDHNSAEFKISISGQTKDFSVNRISSGNSTDFNVYMPDIKAADARYGKIEYVSSSVSYYVK